MSEGQAIEPYNPKTGTKVGGEYDETAVWLCGKLRDHSHYTVGLLLTAVEAALGETKQAEALKAIVRREMYLLMDRNQSEVYERAKMQRIGLAPKEVHIDDQDEDKAVHTVR